MRRNTPTIATFTTFTCAATMLLATRTVLASEDSSTPAPDTLVLQGKVFDFPESHPDFELRPEAGFGVYCGNVATQLGDDGKPLFTGAGWKLSSQWRDSAGRNICYALFDQSAGDIAGQMGASDPASTESAETFDQWFRDVPGVNMSRELDLTLVRQTDGSYVFDDKADPEFQALEGFFPIEDQLLGNPGGSPDRNFHFTFELKAEFTYDAGGDQVFKFIGDDDVWVFIDRQLVIDLGGVHGASEQYVDLNRLGLTDGENYELHFFFAERHRTQSNFRIETNLALQPVEIPSIMAAFD